MSHDGGVPFAMEPNIKLPRTNLRGSSRWAQISMTSRRPEEDPVRTKDQGRASQEEMMLPETPSSNMDRTQPGGAVSSGAAFSAIVRWRRLEDRCRGAWWPCRSGGTMTPLHCSPLDHPDSPPRFFVRLGVSVNAMALARAFRNTFRRVPLKAEVSPWHSQASAAPRYPKFP